jgi:hypothetical protein
MGRALLGLVSFALKRIKEHRFVPNVFGEPLLEVLYQRKRTKRR